MEGHRMPRGGRLFGDQLVTATELNRRSGAILDMALSKPVTITRNDQHFALLRRELVAQLSALSDQVSMYAEAVEGVIHEWHESAIAAESEVLDEAFEAESEPIALTPPSNDRGTIDA
jgi:hypothetical protein